MKIVIALAYLVGIMFTHRMIVDSNIPDTNPQPGSPDNNPNLSPLWAIIWPVFWLKTVPFFYELHYEEKNMSPQGSKAEE